MLGSSGGESQPEFLGGEHRGDELRHGSIELYGTLWMKKEACGCSLQHFLPKRWLRCRLLLKSKDIDTNEAATELQKRTFRYWWLIAHLNM